MISAKQPPIYFLLHLGPPGIFMLLLLVTFQAKGQSDSLALDSNFVPVGFVVGGGLSRQSFEVAAQYADTMQQWQAEQRAFFTVGFTYRSHLGGHVELLSGLLFTLGTMHSVYTLSSQTQRTETTNYSTLSLPLLLQWNFSHEAPTFYLKTGLMPEFDISKKVEKNQRVFPLKPLVATAYLSFGRQFKTDYTRPAVELFYSFSLHNILGHQQTFYSDDLGLMRLSRLGILFSIN